MLSSIRNCSTNWIKTKLPFQMKLEIRGIPHFYISQIIDSFCLLKIKLDSLTNPVIIYLIYYILSDIKY